MHSTGVIDFCVWLLVFEVLAFSSWPCLAWMLPSAPDRGYGLSKIAGFLVFGIVAWFIPALGIAPASRSLVTLVFAALLLTGYLSYVRQIVPLGELRETARRYALSVEAIFLGLSAFFAFIRYLNPEIFWGEKPMDSTFLHFLVRNETLPPQDPWAAGNTMRYYYVGIYMIACFAKLTGIPASIVFNLAISTLGGLIGAGLFTIIAFLTKSRRFAAATAPLIVLASDPEVLKLCYFEGKPANFDTFWASTRVFTSPWFFEYTSWSLLFADLHAHVVAIPVTVMVVALGVYLFCEERARYSLHGLVLRGVLGAAWGALFGMNTWDFITFGLMLALFISLAPAAPFWKPPARPDGSVSLTEKLFAHGFARLVALAWDGLPMLVAAFLIVAPYSTGSGAGVKAGWGWASHGEFNTLGQVIRMLGYWFALFALSCVVIKCAPSRSASKWSRADMITCAVILGAMFSLPFSSMLNGITGIPWGIVSCSTVIVLIAWNFFWRQQASPSLKVVGLMTCLAGFLVTLLELFFLIDRMNTLFKGYQAVGLLLALSSICLVHSAWSSIKNEERSKLALLLGGGFVVVVGLSLLGTLLNVKAVKDLKRVPERFYTLDGQAYLAASAPSDYAMIRWLNENVQGTPTILEAHGDSYREFTRIAMHTGLPTVLGWEYHVLQRGLAADALESRKMAVGQIYSSPEIEGTKRLVLEYGVELVVVGDIELQTYPGEGLAKFARHPEVFWPVFQNQKATIYATYFSPYYQMSRGVLNR